MSSPFSSALARLDESLQKVQVEIESLGAALEVNEDRLIHGLANARQHAARLRDMVHEQRPDAHWEDRKALGLLVQELEDEIAHKEKRDQQRREKLLDLAGELDAGTVKHRFDSRSAALNTLRLLAVRELRAEAAVANNVKALGGPDANAWLAWACGLLEGRDAAVLAQLRHDFPHLERFAGEMEEGYWAPAQRRAETRTPSSSPAAAAPPVPPSLGMSVFDGPPPPSPPVRRAVQAPKDASAEFYNVSGTASYGRAVAIEAERNTAGGVGSASRDSGAPRPETQDDALIDLIAAAPHVKICDRCAGTFPRAFQVCPFDGAPLQQFAGQAPAAGVVAKRSTQEKGQSAAHAPLATGAPAPRSRPIKTDYVAGTGLVLTDEEPVAQESESESKSEYERLQAVIRENAEEAQFRLLEANGPHKKLLIAFATTAGVVLLSVALVLAYRASGLSMSKLGSTVLAAGANMAGVATTPVPDSEIKRNIEQKLALLKGSTIQVSVDKGVVTLVGQSPSKWEALHAESLASQTAGVKSVNGEVEIADTAQNAAPKKPRGKTKTEARVKPVATAGN